MTAVNYSNIPQEIQLLNQWVVWRFEERNGKLTKVPYMCDGSGKPAKSTDPNTWASCNNARLMMMAAATKYDGVGFVVTADDQYIGVDLDHVINTEGNIEPWAIDVLNTLNSYTEVTPSGDGLRVWVKGKLPAGRRRRGNIEMYESGRYFTVTGCMAGHVTTIEERQAEVESVHANYVELKNENEELKIDEPGEIGRNREQSGAVNINDTELLNKARNAKNGAAAFIALYDRGEIGNDHSAADLALCNLLAFWCNGDAVRMDTLFRNSALMREKWNKKHNADGRTYGELTIARAIGDMRGNGYEGPVDDGWYTAKQAAAVLDIAIATIYKRIANNVYPIKINDKGIKLINIHSTNSTDQVENRYNDSTNSTARNDIKETFSTNSTDHSTNEVENINRSTIHSTISTGHSTDYTGHSTNSTIHSTDHYTNDYNPFDYMPAMFDATKNDPVLLPSIDPVIANNRQGWVEYTEEKTGKAKNRLVYYARTINDIVGDLKRISGDWPKTVNGQLFYQTADDTIKWLQKSNDLFAWLHNYNHPSWKSGNDYTGLSYVTKDEFYSGLQMSPVVNHYNDIAFVPHEPMMKDVYYSWVADDYQPTGLYFYQLMSLFGNGTTKEDNDLIAAMFCTPAWGGPCGSRPVFSIVADDRGYGKSTIAEMVGKLYGGKFEYSENKYSDEQLISRLLTPEFRHVRVLRYDNAKGNLSSALIESLVTTDAISGHQKYVGEGMRPNILTWIITSNTIEMSRDMAERSYIIALRKPDYMPNWEGSVNKFIEENQKHILMDICWLLRGKQNKLSIFDRWSNWAREVMSRLSDNPDAVMTMTQNRRNEVDMDVEEAQLIVEEIIKLGQGEYYAPNWYLYPVEYIYGAMRDALGLSFLKPRVCKNILENHIKANRLKLDIKYHRTESKRGFLIYCEPKSDIE
jgi:primase-polymerase (primpol)-like protein